MQSIFDQLFAFSVTIGIGFLAGILFDIYRVFRGLWGPRKLGTFIGDFLFWLIMTGVVFTLLLIGNWGEIRIYVFIGMALGAYFYVRLLSKKWKELIRKIFIWLNKVLIKAWKVISWPFRMVLKLLLFPIGFLLSGINLGFNFIKRSLRKLGGKIKSLWPVRKRSSFDDEDEEERK